MKKNDAIALFETLVTFRVEEANKYRELASACESKDEQNELLKQAKKNDTHTKYLSRITDNGVILDAVAQQVAMLKITEQQIKDIEGDAYSLRKLSELLVSFVQKRKVNDEHSFSEALAVIASGSVTESDAVAFGKKMRNKNGAPYGARQAQMTLKLLERLKACTTKRDGRNVIFALDFDSPVLKRILAAYE